MPTREEVVLPLPSPRSSIPRATSVRSTWIASSIRGLRERGHLDRYFALLPESFHDAVRTTAAGVWLPIDVAMAHYEAADRLELSAGEVLELGVSATRSAHGGIVNVLRTLAGGAGATPWSLLGQLQRVWERSWIGAAVGVLEARTEGSADRDRAVSAVDPSPVPNRDPRGRRRDGGDLLHEGVRGGGSGALHVDVARAPIVVGVTRDFRT